MNSFVTSLLKKKKFHIAAEGNSMLPLLQSEDVLDVHSIPYSRLRVNDILFVHKNRKHFVHRLIYKTHRYGVTKGDNVLCSDGKVVPRQIVGKVVKIKRNGTWIDTNDLYFFQSAIYWSELVKLTKELRKEKIPFVFLKGLPFFYAVKSSYPLRFYSDCDILVEGTYKRQVDHILRKLKYSSIDLTASFVNSLLGVTPTELEYYKTVQSFVVMIDIHYEVVFLSAMHKKFHVLFPQQSVDAITSDFLNHRAYRVINGSEFPFLSSLDAILYLSLHFFHHNFKGIYQLDLLDSLIRRYTQSTRSGEIAIKNALNHYAITNFVYPVFVLLQKYFPNPRYLRLITSFQMKPKIHSYIRNHVLPYSVFDNEGKNQAPLVRFKKLFYLSPESTYRKIQVFSNPVVFITIVKYLMRFGKAFLLTTVMKSAFVQRHIHSRVTR